MTIPLETQFRIASEKSRIKAMPPARLMSYARQLVIDLYQQQARFRHTVAAFQGISSPPKMQDGLFVLPLESEAALTNHLRSLDKMQPRILQTHATMMMSYIVTTEHGFQEIVKSWGKPGQSLTIPVSPHHYNQEAE